MYAFVDVAQYQIVGTGQTIDEAKRNYRETLGRKRSKIHCQGTGGKRNCISGTVEAIENVVVSGNTYYYFTLTDDRTDSVSPLRSPFPSGFRSCRQATPFPLSASNGSTKEVITWR